MLFTNRDYFITTDPVDKKLLLQAQDFITEGEKILCTFEAGDITAFFTNKKIIFVADIKSKFFETDIIPYSNIIRCTVVGSSDTKYGRLNICISDEITLPFMLYKYETATKLCNKILSYM